MKKFIPYVKREADYCSSVLEIAPFNGYPVGGLRLQGIFCFSDSKNSHNVIEYCQKIKDIEPDTGALKDRGANTLKIKQIIIILFIVLSVFPMLFLGIANMYFYNDKVIRVMENDLKNTVSTQMKAINNFLTERRNDVEIFVKNPLIQTLLEEENPSNMEKSVEYMNNMLLLSVLHNEYVESATLLNTDFNVVACSEPSGVGVVSKLKNIDSKYLSPELLFTPVIETQRNGQDTRVIAAVMEIYAQDSLSGYFVLELNLDFFAEIRDSAKVYNNGTIYVVDGNGALVTAGDSVSSRDEYVLSLDELTDYFRARGEEKDGSVDGVLRYTARGEHYISCYAQFQDMDWTILSSVNVDRLLEIKKGYWELGFQIIIVLACLLLAVNYVIRRYLGRPIREMIYKFKLIEETGDYTIRMNSLGNNEISTISVSVNSLLAGMEQYVIRERRIKEDLKSKAESDPLTGLYNKEAFHRILERELGNARRCNAPLACVFLDIDDFKDFNTNHGHSGGDKVLVFIAEALRSQIGDLASRQGGDEFMVCIPDASDRDFVKRMLEDLLSSLHHGLRLDEKGGRVSVNCSIGVAFSDESTVTADQLIERSDEAMYEVKKEKKNGYCFWQG